MRVFIANFGAQNYLWPKCLARSTIGTYESEDLRPFSENDDRAGFIARCLATKKTERGISPTVPVASRWFNIGRIVSTTVNDIWIHREKADLWWTSSRDGEVDVSLQPAFGPAHAGEKVYELHKPAEAWSNKNRRGVSLSWDALHPKARDFLFTEATVQQLSPSNADYAVALLDGTDLTAWHRLPAWVAKESAAGRGAATIFDAKRRAVIRMARTAADTVAASRGQQVLRTLKRKELRFLNDQAFQDYIDALVDAQEGLCAITDLPLEYDGDHSDPELLCSLDRIDSNGHYEAGNLQVVCRFVNRWKNADEDATFRRLVDLLRKADRLE